MNAKEEISLVPLFSRKSRVAMLSGIIHTAGSIVLNSEGLALAFEGINPLTQGVIHSLLLELYNVRDLDSAGKELIARGAFFDKLMQECHVFRQNASFEREIIPGIEPSLLKGDGARTAYIRGMFLGAGSLSLKRGYHLEFVVSNTELAKDLVSLLESFSIKASITTCKRGFLVYLKGHQSVSDCLALMGAAKCVMELNNRYAKRMVTQLANRRLNCDLANIDKTVDAANRQTMAIRLLIEKGRFDSLEPKLKEAANARLDNNEATLLELATIMKISKSGVKHRLNRLVELALDVQNANSNNDDENH